MRSVAAAAHGNSPLLFALAIAAAFAAVVAWLPVGLRSRYLPILSLAAAVAYLRLSAIGFLLDIAIAYGGVRWLGTTRDPAARWRLACTGMLLVGVIFVAGRLTHASPFLFALDMWLVLRLITVLWEVGSGAVAAPPAGAYIAWTCLPLTLVGPLLRYSEFAAPAQTERPRWHWARELGLGLAKLAAGVGLGAVDIALDAALVAAHPVAPAVRGLVTGPLGFYLTFAGYYHAMQALGRPAGISLPDSFNWPIGRPNIAEFWANWNMTATRVFRDYLFYNRWGRGGYNIFLNTFLLFLLMGLWHGAGAYWVIFGVLHGLLFCGFLLWRKYRSNLAGLPLRGTLAAKIGSRVLTYVAVCACWYLPTKIVIRFGRL